MKRIRPLCFLLILVVLTSCSPTPDVNAVDSAVLPAWEGKFSVEQRKNAIAEYQKKYIPIYVVNLEGEYITFQLDFEGTSCGNVILTPVDDSTKGAELNTVMDFAGQAEVNGKTVTVDISWWFDAKASVRTYKLWSYLFWVKDADDVQHYYYFRVDYTV